MFQIFSLLELLIAQIRNHIRAVWLFNKIRMEEYKKRHEGHEALRKTRNNFGRKCELIIH